MEDSDEEWEIEEYPACSNEEETESKASWILSKGLWLGKKVVMTGVVITSAPLVLPPLVVVSALGLAFSVPFGIAFASYTCTEKLMSKLLPMPASAKLLEYEPEGEVDMEEEDKRQMEDPKKEVEMRIELVEDGKEQEEGDVLPEKSENSHKNVKAVEEEKFYKDESFIEKGYQEDDGNYMEADNKGLLGGETRSKGSKNEQSPPVVKQVVVVVQEQKKSATIVQKTDELVMVARTVHGETENAKAELSKEETTGLPQKMRDEGNSCDHGKKHKKKNKHRLKKSHGIEGKEKAESVSTKETENPSKVGDKELEKLVAEIESHAKTGNETTLDEGKVKDKGEGNIEATVETKGNINVAGKPTSILINGTHAKENPNIREEEVKPEVGRTEVTEGLRMKDATVSKGYEVVGPGPQNNSDNGTCPDAGAGNNQHKQSMEEGDVEFLENAAQAGFKTSKHHGVPSNEKAAMPSSGILPSEAKLWEQVNAIRVIVGYKAECQPSFVDELKALYIFTGVEPPSSFENSSDIREAEEKLHFLMSIIGVK